MSDEEIYNKACDRVEKVNGFKRMSHKEIIIELEKEIDVYREKIEKLKSRLNSICGEPAETFTEERESDGGTMTLDAKTANWKIAAAVLLHNGYFICCHFDDIEKTTITIEFWRA